MDNAPLEIGFYQLKNLFDQGIGFVFIHVGPKADLSGVKSVASYLDRSEHIEDPELAISHIATAAPDKSHPVVLICEKGEHAPEVALRLSSEGYLNVCVMEGGVAAILESGDAGH